MTKIVEEKVSSVNGYKLLNLLTDQVKIWQLKVELSAYVEGLKDLRHLCYFLEGDGTDLPFKVGFRISQLEDTFPRREIPTLPSTTRLIEQAI